MSAVCKCNHSKEDHSRSGCLMVLRVSGCWCPCDRFSADASAVLATGDIVPFKEVPRADRRGER